VKGHQREPEKCQCIIPDFLSAGDVGMLGRHVDWAVVPAPTTLQGWFKNPNATHQSSHDQLLE